MRRRYILLSLDWKGHQRWCGLLGFTASTGWAEWSSSASLIFYTSWWSCNQALLDSNVEQTLHNFHCSNPTTPQVKLINSALNGNLTQAFHQDSTVQSQHIFMLMRKVLVTNTHQIFHVYAKCTLSPLQKLRFIICNPFKILFSGLKPDWCVSIIRLATRVKLFLKLELICLL